MKRYDIIFPLDVDVYLIDPKVEMVDLKIMSGQQIQLYHIYGKIISSGQWERAALFY